MSNFTATGNFAARGADKVDAALVAILEEAASRAGVKVEAYSGYRPGDKRAHGKGKATDIRIVGQDGKPLPNYQDAAAFGTYEKLAQEARKIQMEKYPELADRFRWGGYFSGRPGKYGAMDLMHFDVAGGDGLGMAGGSWEKGLTEEQLGYFPEAKSKGLGSMAVVDRGEDRIERKPLPTVADASGLKPWEKHRRLREGPSTNPRNGPQNLPNKDGSASNLKPWEKHRAAQEAKRSPAYEEAAGEMSAITRSFDSNDPQVKITPGRQSTNIKPGQHGNTEQYGSVLDVAIGQGVMLGAGDEVGAAAAVPRRMLKQYRDGRPVDISDAYDEGLETERARVANFRERNPVGSVVAEIGGGIAGGLVAVPKAAATVVGRLAQNSLTGAGFGGVYGFNSGEGGAKNRLTDATYGARDGALIGAAIPAALGAAKIGYNMLSAATVRPAMNAIRSTVNPQQNALQLAQRSLGRDSLTPAQAAGKMDEAIAAGDDTTMLMDVAGDNTRRLGRFASNIPGKGADKLKDAVHDRQLAQPERIAEAVKKGLDDPEIYFSTVDDIIAKRQTAAEPIYKAAWEVPVPFTAKLESLLGRGKVMRDALRKARDMGEAEGIPSKSFFAKIADDGSYTVESVPDARQWDLMKRSLDDIIEDEKTIMPNSAEKLSNLGRIVSGIKREMLAEIDAANPTYALARKAYSSSSESLDAVTKGGKLLDADPELAKRTLAEMSEGDKQLARLGISKALVDRVMRRADGANTVRAIFASPKHRAVLKEVFPSKESYDEFKAAMEREGQKTRTKNAIGGNSTTAQQVTDIADNQVDMGVVGNLVTGRFAPAVGAVIQKALSRATVVNEATAKELADILTTTDPQVAKQIMGEMQRLAMKDARVAKNLVAVRALLRNSGIFASTKGVADAERESLPTHPRILGQQSRRPLEITVGRPVNAM